MLTSGKVQSTYVCLSMFLLDRTDLVFTSSLLHPPPSDHTRKKKKKKHELRKGQSPILRSPKREGGSFWIGNFSVLLGQLIVFVFKL